MIILEKLEFSNMYSYGEGNEIDLNKSQITQLNAPNGSGKSSCALILQEFLYSKNIKGIKKGDIKHRYLPTDTWNGRIHFTDTDTKNQYRVEVTRKNTSSKVSLYENNEDISEHKVPDTYKKIKSILGMDFEIFSQLTYQSSVDSLMFIKATDTNRKKFLINLFNLNKYIEIGDVLKLKLNESEKEYTLQNGELSGINKFLDGTTIPQKQDFIEVPEIDSSLSERKALLQKEIENYNSLCSKIDKNNLYREEAHSLQFNISLQEPSTSITQEEITQLSSELFSVDSQIQTTINELKRLDTADRCFACGQPIDNSKSLEIKTRLEEKRKELEIKEVEIRNKLKSTKSKYSEYEKSVREFNQNKKKIERFEQLNQLIDNTVPQEYPNISSKKKELQEIEDSLKNQKEKVNKAIDHNSQVTVHNTRINALIDQKREFLAKKELLERDIEKSRKKVQNINILRKAFSTSGIVAFKLENLAKELEDTINYYLAELSGGQFQVIFRLTGEKLNVVVRDDGKESPIETVSGGEFGRIQVAILLAIRNILSKIGGNTVNLLFLDEIDGVLDAFGKEKLIEVLREENNLNVFLISHSFTHPLIDKVSIIKEDKVSKIECL